MQNPWNSLPAAAPYVLPEDAPILLKYASKLTGDKAVRPEVLPAPFIGSPDTAQVILLALNPDFKERDIGYQDGDPDFADLNLKALTFESRTPFFYLDPAHPEGGGYLWWHRRLRYFIQRYGLKAVGERFMCVQLFPYHSRSYAALPERLPSQEYSFQIVRQAIQERKPVVIMRSREQWLRAVPELQHYGYIELRFPRTPYIERHHMTEDEFARLNQAFRD